MAYALGMKVRMTNPRPRYGLGQVKVGDVGKVTRVCDGPSYWVNFPTQRRWNGEEKDLAPFDNIEEEE